MRYTDNPIDENAKRLCEPFINIKSISVTLVSYLIPLRIKKLTPFTCCWLKIG